MEEELNGRQHSTSFESLDTLIHKWKTGELKEVLDDWRWIFTYTLRYKWIVAYCLVLGVVSTTLGLIGSIASKYLIDIVTGYQTDKLWILITVFVGSSLFGLTVGSVLSRVNAKLGIYINNDIQADIFDKIIDADWLALNKYSHGDVLNRFNGDISAVSSNAIGWIPSIIIAMYQFVATFCVIWYYDHIMALLAFVSAPFLLLASRTVIKKQREYGKRVRQMSSEMMTFEVETFYNFDTIKSFGVSSLYGRKLRDWQQKFKKVSLDYNWFTIKTNIYLSVVGMLVGFLVFGYCLFRLWTHAITFGTMTLFMRQREALSGAFNRLIGIIPSFLNSSISAHRIRELVELPREVHVERSNRLDAYAAEGLTIEMQDADFAYREGNNVIRQSQLVARAGEIVALVGASGEGKTTLIRLILGLVYPQSGTVKLRSIDGTEVEMNAETRHLMAYVPQGNTILQGTVAENLRMGKENATDAELEEALRTACAWEFVERMPDGLNSKVGERGRGLSEGQVQRLAIARALLRDAPVLLLDEATSALDVTTERKVLGNIIKRQPNKTCIVTTHRPTVLSMCQRVYRVIDTHVTELSAEESARMAMDF